MLLYPIFILIILSRNFFFKFLCLPFLIDALGMLHHFSNLQDRLIFCPPFSNYWWEFEFSQFHHHFHITLVWFSTRIFLTWTFLFTFSTNQSISIGPFGFIKENLFSFVKFNSLFWLITCEHVISFIVLSFCVASIIFLPLTF